MALPLPGFHFKVEWGGTNIGFSEASGLTMEIQPIEYRDGASSDFNTIKMPGLPKTANVVLNTAFGEPTIAVDTHIFRVANRTGLARGKTPLQVELKLLKAVPRDYLQHAHHWLILHGRYTCKARKPNCPECIVRDLCSFRDKTSPTGT